MKVEETYHMTDEQTEQKVATEPEIIECVYCGERVSVAQYHTPQDCIRHLRQRLQEALDTDAILERIATAMEKQVIIQERIVAALDKIAALHGLTTIEVYDGDQ